MKKLIINKSARVVPYGTPISEEELENGIIEVEE